jgi:hypothetical protein
VHVLPSEKKAVTAVIKTTISLTEDLKVVPVPLLESIGIAVCFVNLYLRFGKDDFYFYFNFYFK